MTSVSGLLISKRNVRHEIKAYSHEDENGNETSNDDRGVRLDPTVAADASRLTFHQDQTLLDPNDNV